MGMNVPLEEADSSPVTLAQLEKHQRRTVFKLKRKPVPANLILIQHAGTEFVVFPCQPADRVTDAIHLYKPIGTQARLAVVIRSVGDIFAFAAIAVLTMQDDSHFIGQGQV